MSVSAPSLEDLDFPDTLWTWGFWTTIGVGLGLVRWLNLCYRYAEEHLGARGFKQKWWTAAGWIIPVLNFFKPYQIINELYKAGSPHYHAPDDWKKESGSPYLLAWWIFWILTHQILIIAALRLLPARPENLTLAVKLEALSSVSSLAVAALWFLVANSLTDRLLARPPLSRIPRRMVSRNEPDSVELSASSGNGTRLTPRNRRIGEAAGGEAMLTAKEEVGGASGTRTENGLGETSDDWCFFVAFREVESGSTVQGLWAKCFADADGDENKAKARYIKARAARLKAEQEAQTQQQNLQSRYIEPASASPAKRSGAAAQEGSQRATEEQVDSLTFEKCLALLAEAGYSVESKEAGFWVQALHGPSSAPSVLEGVAQLQEFVETHITFANASLEACIAQLVKLGCTVAERPNGLYYVTLPSGVRRVLATVEEFRELLQTVLTRGRCPNCAGLIALNSHECPKCNVILAGSGRTIERLI